MVHGTCGENADRVQRRDRAGKVSSLVTSPRCPLKPQRHAATAWSPPAACDCPPRSSILDADGTSGTRVEKFYRESPRSGDRHERCPCSHWPGRARQGRPPVTSLSFVLLLTPTGSLPSPRWRWWARVTVAAPVTLLVAVAVASGSLNPQYQLAGGGPFDFRGLGGALLVVNQVALAVTTLALVVAAGSLVVRFRRARGVERQQLRWVALATALVVLSGVVVLCGLAVGATATVVVTWAIGACVAILPVAIGAAVLRYRLYDLDRIISRALAYGLLTVLLGGGYAGVVLGLG